MDRQHASSQPWPQHPLKTIQNCDNETFYLKVFFQSPKTLSLHFGTLLHPGPTCVSALCVIQGLPSQCSSVISPPPLLLPKRVFTRATVDVLLRLCGGCAAVFGLLACRKPGTRCRIKASFNHVVQLLCHPYTHTRARSRFVSFA